MKWIALTLGFILPAFASSYAAEPDHPRSELIIFGGVGDPVGTKNIFQADFISLSRAFRARNWDVEPLFGDRTSRCTDCSQLPPTWRLDPIAEAAGKSPSQIPAATFSALTQKLDDAIANLQSGDQLLIMIDTHGESESVYRPYPHDTTYLTVASSGNEGDSSTLLSIDQTDLLRRYKMLKDKGVRLAFVNDSCHGGHAVPLLSKYGCVVTGSSGDELNFGATAGDALASVMQDDIRNLNAVSVGHNGKISFEDVWMRTLINSWQFHDISKSPDSPYALNLEPEYSGEDPSEHEVDEAMAKWFDKVKRNYLIPQSNGRYAEGAVSDLAPLQEYSSRFLAPYVDPGTSAQDLATVQYFLQPLIAGRVNLAGQIVGAEELVRRIRDIAPTLDADLAQINAANGAQDPRLQGLATGEQYLLYHLEARMYANLARHHRLASRDAAIQDCSNFVLRN